MAKRPKKAELERQQFVRKMVMGAIEGVLEHSGVEDEVSCLLGLRDDLDAYIGICLDAEEDFEQEKEEALKENHRDTGE